MHTQIRFADMLVELRKRAGLNQTDLGTAIGLSRSSVVNWETGSRPPRKAVCNQIARALGVSPEMLWRVAAWDRIGAEERLVVEAKLRHLRALAAVSLDDADVDAELSYNNIRQMLQALHPDILPSLLKVLRGMRTGASMAGVNHKDLVGELSSAVERIENWPPAATYTAINSCIQLIASVESIRSAVADQQPKYEQHSPDR